MTIEENIQASLLLIRNSKLQNPSLEKFIVDFINEINSSKLDNMDKFFKEKEILANSKFKDNDLEIALIGLNTGKSSLLYWEKNLENWNSLFGITSSQNRDAGPGKAIGAADVAGATVGAINGALGGTCVLPGIGTCTGALAGGCAGGMYASIGAGAASLFLSLFR